MTLRVLLIGAGGVFGSRIARGLAGDPCFRLILAGRHETRLTGSDKHGQPLKLCWSLSAAAGDGPQIPATPAVVLARKFADGQLFATGAMPCMGLFTLDEALAAFDGFAIETGLERMAGA